MHRMRGAPWRILTGYVTAASRSGAALVRESSSEPGLDVRHDLLLAEIVEQVVVVPVVELERLVLGAGLVVEALAAGRLRRLVRRAVKDQHREFEERELLPEAFVRAHHRGDGLRRL